MSSNMHRPLPLRCVHYPLLLRHRLPRRVHRLHHPLLRCLQLLLLRQSERKLVRHEVHDIRIQRDEPAPWPYDHLPTTPPQFTAYTPPSLLDIVCSLAYKWFIIYHRSSKITQIFAITQTLQILPTFSAVMSHSIGPIQIQGKGGIFLPHRCFWSRVRLEGARVSLATGTKGGGARVRATPVFFLHLFDVGRCGSYGWQHI